MSFVKVHRKDHNQRAERLEARFSATWTGDPNTATIVPGSAPPPTSPNPAAANPPPQSPPPAAPAPVKPTSPVPAPAPVVPTTSARVPVPPPSVSSSTVPSVASTTLVTPTTSSTPTIVKTTPAIVPTTPSTTRTTAFTTAVRTVPDAASFSITSSASPSSTAAPSSSLGTGSIIGIAAGSIAGVALVGALGIWVLKRYFQSNDHDESGGFQRHSWMRNSVALPDDAPSPIHRGPSTNPRPPTMIERKQTVNYSNVAPFHGGYPQGNMAYSNYQDSPYGAHGMPSFSPGQHLSSPPPNSANAFFSPIASSPPPGSPGMASFDDTAPPMQHASYGAGGAPLYFSRHDSNMSAVQPDSAALPTMPNPHGIDADGYATLDRSSVTPYQAQQYAEISQQLQNPGALASVAEAEHAPPAGNGPSPFDDPVREDYQDLPLPAPAHPRVGSVPPTLPPMRTMSPVGPGAHASFAQIANAFPAAPVSPGQVSGSPKASTFSQSPPLSPGVGPQKGQVVSVPESVHVGRETPVQFGFNNPGPVPQIEEPKAVRRMSAKSVNANRLSVSSKRSVPKVVRPETMYDEEDAYGGI